MTRIEARPAFTPSPAQRTIVARRTWRTTKRWLYWFHRWLGVVTCLLCVMWFLSGLVMLYVPFPSFGDAERVATLPAVDTGAVKVLPDAALVRSDVSDMPATFRLEMFAGQPVYRIVTGKARTTISAVTGDPLGRVTAEQAAKHIAFVFPDAHPSPPEVVDYDQWTPTKRFDPHRHLYRFALNDAAGTSVYVSSQTGEIVQNATRSERGWNWVGAVPHWIYFAPIRRDQDLWRQAVMWLSGPLVIGAISGVIVGILRLRLRVNAGRSITPYRGWMKWHHLAGLIGGVFVCTWIFSGWLSVNPFKWFARTQLTDQQLTAYAGWTTGRRLGVTEEALAASQGASDVSFAWVGGRPLILASSPRATKRLDPTAGQPVSLADDTLIAAAKRMYPAERIASAQRLGEETLYWYSHHDVRPLPVIEVKFDDPNQTWIYLDPATAAIAGLSDRSARANRWLFDFLHDFDLPVLLRHPPARDILIWILSLAGLVISITGVVIGWRTLKRSI